MGITERKEREKMQRREAIIDAAEKVFFSRGVEHATMDDVAEAAELSKGTLYLYFSSKEELYMAINLRGFVIITSLFEKAVDTGENGLNKVLRIGQAYVDFYRKYPDYFQALLFYEARELKPAEGDSCAEACFEAGHAPQEILIGAIEEGIRDGSIRPDIDPRLTATILWGQSTGIIQLFITKGRHLEEAHGVHMDEIIREAYRLMGAMLQNTIKPA